MGVSRLVIADVLCPSDFRRSSVPSQQHLIVDAPDIRSQFQALQRNGFSSTGSGLRCVIVMDRRVVTCDIELSINAR